MSNVTTSKLLEIALNSSDPLIKETVDKLIFALKLKYSDEDFLNIYDNYVYHHGVNIHLPTTGEEMQISVAWKRENFRVVSFEHQMMTGTTGDFVNDEAAAAVYLPWDMNYKA